MPAQREVRRARHRHAVLRSAAVVAGQHDERLVVEARLGHGVAHAAAGVVELAPGVVWLSPIVITANSAILSQTLRKSTMMDTAAVSCAHP